MGYYTSHELQTSLTNDIEQTKIIANFHEVCENARYAISDEGYCNEPSKWRDPEDDLREFSKLYPEVLFTLIGDGEEQGDLWRLYVKNGKAQMATAVLTYPEYDESQMS